MTRQHPATYVYIIAAFLELSEDTTNDARWAWLDTVEDIYRNGGEAADIGGEGGE